MTFRNIFWMAAALGVIFTGAACVERTPGSNTKGVPRTESLSGAASTNRQTFQVKGVVKELLGSEKKVRIAHEKIPDYMEAMTMVFDVKDAKELEGLGVGDEVEFRMVVTDDDGWIERISKTGKTTEVLTALPSAVRLARDVEPLEVGDLMPQYRFTNETGQAISLEDCKGRPYVFTFVFTRCPFPTYCPRMSMRFNEAYQGLTNNAAAPKGWHLFSITIDPEYDTPQVLKNYAQAYTYDPTRWNYLTGSLIDITAIGEQFGLQFYRPNPDQPAGINHNLRTVVVNAAGRVQAILVGNEWTAEELIAEMLKAGS